MKMTYKQRLFFWFFIIFVAFAAVMIIVEQSEEKKYRTQALELSLNNYTEIIHSLIEKDSLMYGSITKLDRLLNLLPSDIRATVIKDDGSVLYDNDKKVSDIEKLENHLNRPEIMKAFYQKAGSNIRMSASTNHEYLYYAKYFDKYFVRVALPYNIEVKSALRPDRMFIYISLVMLVAGLILLNFISGRFGKSISRLQQLTTDIKNGKMTSHKINFPNDELGEIGKQLTQIIEQKEKNEHDLKLEREKMSKHFQFSKNGLCIFDANRTKIYCNTRFMQYLNMVTDSISLNAGIVFTDKAFEPIQQFLKDYPKNQKQNNLTYLIELNGKIFEIQTVVFDDSSFEVGIKDITEAEHTRQLKKEMTSNITHELRTPVTSLRGYLETLDTQTLESDKQKQFVHRAYIQSIRLSSIVEDLGLISKMEEASDQFKLEKLDITQIINDVRIDLIDKLNKSNVKLNLTLNNPTLVRGNYTLLYSIFRNLIDNSIEYGGKDIDIYINNYLEDDHFLYFSYYDTGKGVEEKHLNRLFERFYRGDSGRTREQGGSGLGLSIVRNAVKFHRGEVQAKNRKDAGLEFLFTLSK